MKEKILVICDDFWHPAEVIEKGFSYLEGGDYEFEIIKTAKDILTPEMIAEYPVVVCCSGNTVNSYNTAPWFEEGVTEVCPKELRAYIENGGSYVLIHAGVAVSKRMLEGKEEKFSKPGMEYLDLIGCEFVGHPPRCEVTVSVVNPEHPIMRDVNDFTERDEHYQMNVTAEYVTPLFETSSESGGSGKPAGFLFPVGAGRVVVLTPGHTLAVWQNPEFQKIVRNTLDYCTGKLE